MTSEYNDSVINEYEAFFLGRNDIINRLGNLISHFRTLPGIVGVWYAGNVQRSTGDIYDSSGQVRVLSYNGNPTFNYLSNGVAYADLDGTGDRWSRSDETDLDISGTETIFNSAVRGMTIYIWIKFDDVTTAQGIMSKYLGSGDRSWWLQCASSIASNLTMSISGDGFSISETVTNGPVSTGTWYFVASRFVPSTSLDLWINSSKATETATVPAQLGNSSGSLHIGSLVSTTRPLDGQFSIAALCANQHSDSTVISVYEQTRTLFGV